MDPLITGHYRPQRKNKAKALIALIFGFSIAAIAILLYDSESLI